MQTLTDLAKEIIRWERLGLSRGAYRIQHMARVQVEDASTEGYRDCSYDDLFADDLILVKTALGLSGGVWFGVMSDDEALVIVLALRME